MPIKSYGVLIAVWEGGNIISLASFSSGHLPPLFLGQIFTNLRLSRLTLLP
jgi:hypothetical protein